MADDLSARNSDYWSELCGSRAARKLGITAADPGGVDIFDRWFFDSYPYLADSRFIPWESLVGQSVLEIGLGYGSVTRRLSRYTDQVVALDIAPGPVGFAAATTDRTGCVRGSALSLPFADATLDNVVAIGSLHHTGNMELAFRECMRVLRPGGRLIAMVYNRHSYKRWIVSPIATLHSVIAGLRGETNQGAGGVSRRVSWFWDRSADGSAPPHTEFATKGQIRRLLGKSTKVRVASINVDNPNDLLPQSVQHLSFDRIRLLFLNSWLSRYAGLDLYITAEK